MPIRFLGQLGEGVAQLPFGTMRCQRTTQATTAATARQLRVDPSKATQPCDAENERIRMANVGAQNTLGQRTYGGHSTHLAERRRVAANSIVNMSRQTCARCLHHAIRWLLVGLLWATSVQTAQAQLDIDSINSLMEGWTAANSAGRFKEAETFALRLKANDERYRPDVYSWRTLLGLALQGQGKYEEARGLHESYLKLCRQHEGQSLATLEALLTLGGLEVLLGDYERARPRLEESLQMGRRMRLTSHPSFLLAQQNLAMLHHHTGELPKAVALYREVIDGQYRQGIRDVPSCLPPIMNLGDAYIRQGKYQDAEAMVRYGVKVAAAEGAGLEHPSVLKLMQLLGTIYQDQNRTHEAIPLLASAKKAAEKALGTDHPDVGRMCADLASAYGDAGKYDIAIALRKQALKSISTAHGEQHPQVALQHYNLGWAELADKRFADAEASLRQALEIAGATLGKEHWQVTHTKSLLVHALLSQDKVDEAEKVLQGALDNIDADAVSESQKHYLYRAAACLAWTQQRKEEAIALMDKALDAAESSRQYSSGSEYERAEHFAVYASAYEEMIGWQIEQGKTEVAFEQLERAHARTFQEAMLMADVDLLHCLPGTQRAEIEARRDQLRGRVSTLEANFFALPAQTADEDKEVTKRRDQVRDAVLEARTDLYRFDRDLHTTSLLYRKMIATQAPKVTLVDVRSQLVPHGTLLLSYSLGQESSYLFAVGPKSLRAIELEISEDHAKLWKGEDGPVTRAKMQHILQSASEGSVLQELKKPAFAPELASKLHALFEILLPDEVFKELSAAETKRVVLLLDGPLSLLPFECLVVEDDTDPVFLLDVAPPLRYGPATSVLMGLAKRPAPPKRDKPVLTLGNPLYSVRPLTDFAAGAVSKSVQADSRLPAFRAVLRPLPYTGVESNWVAEAFRKAGAESVQLLGADATEGKLRENVAEKEIIHLACHGLSDGSYGNYFGMLAVAPGAKLGNAQDDGTLTLAEIYELKLDGCELAVLSACLTNHGPEQQGEGVWGLSRGFLVAGARRTIATNWVVDDAAGASLISIMSAKLAKAREVDEAPDYAQALRDGKRWVRKHEKWKSPFFWAPFVLIGPD